MTVRIRLRREGKKKQPFYRIVVADKRAPRDGRFIEDLGYYQPLAQPSEIGLDHERALQWLRDGAEPSEAVVNLLRIEGVWEQFRPEEAMSAAERANRRAAKRAEGAREPGTASEEPAPTPAAEETESAGGADEPGGTAEEQAT